MHTRPSTRRAWIALLVMVSAAFACGSVDEADAVDEGAPAVTDARDDSQGDSQGHSEGDSHEGRTPNRLIHEKSPYLQQHAYNPVDWYPWGDEAFARAKAENMPIFLSIGYSTCHWCHVMERESFENDSIAALMNENFVCIKVDREERPDVDQIYMTAVQALTKRGGWPMSMFLTSEGKPFWGGTYFPPTDMGGRPGFARIITEIGEAWRTQRESIDTSAEQLTAALNQMSNEMLTTGADSVDVGLLDQAYKQLRLRFEPTYGGFSQAPKFPTPHNVLFLLRQYHRTGDEAALAMARKTLDMMAVGGMHDHLGGGFHRYSVDNKWLVSHFEKMLYDQAGLLKAYVEAWLVTGAPEYRHVAEGIVNYLLRDMTDAETGGFYAAEDADSEGHEGTFYVWTPSEVDQILGDDGPRFRELYDVTDAGNFEGENVLHPQAFDPMLDESLNPLRQKLFDVRAKRIRPHLDDKIITAWNGYMIEALALAASAFDEPRYMAAASRAADFIWDSLRDGDTLLRHYRGGAADIAGYIDDYAYYGRALLILFETTGDPKWLERSIEVADEMVARFRNESGVFTFTSSDAEALIAPTVEAYDGAMPSGNSAAAVFLLRLGHLTGDRDREQLGHDVLTGLAGTVSRQPSSHLELMSALTFYVGPISEVVLAVADGGDAGAAELEPFRRRVASGYRPNTVVIARNADTESQLEKLIPFVAAQGAIDGKPTAYVCQDYACRLPVHEPDAFAAELEK